MTINFLAYDVGSTFTKLAAFEESDQGMRLVGRSQTPTTIEDIGIGLERSRRQLPDADTGISSSCKVLAASSAAGGLRMVAMGYMPRVTTKAAREVAMNAGARVMEVVSHEDAPEMRLEILREIRPDIILLTGGTDGGDRDAILQDARLIVKAGVDAVVIIAGNRQAQPAVEERLKGAGVQCRRVRNVLPTIHELHVQSAREAIHGQFIHQIARANGLQRLIDEVSDGKVLPIPGAVLLAAELLAKGTPGRDGLGDLMLIDIGGATTDVHSVLPGLEDLSLEEKGLVVSNEKQMSYRTVEGNLGLRISATGIVEAVGAQGVLAGIDCRDESLAERLKQYTAFVEKHPNHIAADEQERQFDTALAIAAIEVAIKRHAGYLAREYNPVMGTAPGTPLGRDLRNVRQVIAVGGILSHSPPERRSFILRQAFRRPGISLLPTQPAFAVDEYYLMYALGLLAPQAADSVLIFGKQYFSF